jgi:hypothetical protein
MRPRIKTKIDKDVFESGEEILIVLREASKEAE